MRYSKPITALLATLVVAIAPCALADEVLLESGGRIQGRLITDNQDRTKISVALPGGGRVLVDRINVGKAAQESPQKSLYRKLAVRTPDTPETQKKLALWCRDQKLASEFRQHLQRVVQLDPTDSEARRLLGLKEHRGAWITREELMASRGMLLHEGSYRTQQEIDLMQREQRGDKAHATWRKKIARMRRDLNSRDPQDVSAAVAAFQNLDNPAAAPAVVALLKEEQNEETQMLLIETAARLEHASAVQALATLALKDPRYEVRQQCLDHLVRAQRAGLTKIFVRSLKSRENAIVNRAGEALRVIGDPGVASALIDALVTTHQRKIGRDTPRDSYSMDSSGGFSFGGGKAKVQKIDMRNPIVRSALVELTGENFGFDQQAWRRWLASQLAKSNIDLRRDI